MARGVWRDPRLGEQLVGKWFRGRIATRGDLALGTRELCSRLLERWIDAEVPVAGGARARAVRLGAQSLASVTPAVVREWDAAVLTEASRRAGERWSRAASTPKRINRLGGTEARLQQHCLRESRGEDFWGQGTRRHDVDTLAQESEELVGDRPRRQWTRGCARRDRQGCRHRNPGHPHPAPPTRRPARSRLRAGARCGERGRGSPGTSPSAAPQRQTDAGGRRNLEWRNARGDGSTDSDVDLLVVRPAAADEGDPDWQRDLTALEFAVPRWTGNPCEILDRSGE